MGNEMATELSVFSRYAAFLDVTHESEERKEFRGF